MIHRRFRVEGAVQPETKYARLEGDRIAYQVLGQGPPDLVMTRGGYGHLDTAWEDPGFTLFLRSLASFSRLILFDRRGTGASDPLPQAPLPPWESYAEELAAVLDAVGSERAAILAEMDGGPLALFFAGTRPDRTSALILANTWAKFVAADDYPIGISAEVVEAILAQLDQGWGTDALLALLLPSRAGDERFRHWYMKMQRAMASPKAAQPFWRSMLEVDVRTVLPLIQVPTLVLHRRDVQLLPIEYGRYLAEHIPDAKLVELPGADLPLVWAEPQLALDLIEEFLGGVRQTVEEFNGQLVQTTGDGILATFDGPGRGIGCAAALRDQLAGIGLHIRSGLHTGEVELRGDDVGGIAVHIAARVMAAAGSGEILTSRTVRDLIVGSDVTLEDRGIHPLKGVEGTWELFAVVER